MHNKRKMCCKKSRSLPQATRSMLDICRESLVVRRYNRKECRMQWAKFNVNIKMVNIAHWAPCLLMVLLVASLTTAEQEVPELISNLPLNSSQRDTTWSTSSQLGTQLKVPPNDGAKLESIAISLQTPGSTTASPTSTTASDIRKLLENYVAYLSTLDIFHKEQSRHRSRTSRNLAPQSEWATPSQTFTLTPMLTGTPEPVDVANKGKLNNNDSQDISFNGTTTAQPNSSSTDFYYELPTESGLTLKLSDEELNSFIDNVLGASVANDSSNTTDNTTMEPTLSLVKHDDNDLFLTSNTSQLVAFNASQLSNTNITAIGGTSNTSITQISNQSINMSESFSRAEIFDTSEGSDSSREEILNGISTSSTKSSEDNQSESFYTSDDQFVTESANQATTTEPSTLDSKSNTITQDQGFTTKELIEDETNSNNFNRKLSDLDDTELLRELKKTKELLRLQIEKLQQFEHLNENHNPETSSIAATTTESNFKKATVETRLDTETSSTTGTELNAILSANVENHTNAGDSIDAFTFTEWPVLETTTQSAIMEESNVTDSSTPIVDANQRMTTAFVANEQTNSEKNHKEDNTLTATTTERNEILKLGTTVSSLTDPQNSFSLNDTRFDQLDTVSRSNASKLVRNADVENFTTLTPITNTNLPEASAIANLPEKNEVNDAENITSSGPQSLNQTAPSHHLTAPLWNTSFGTVEAVSESTDDRTGESLTDTETMILTHVPKITIIHKIMKPTSGTGTIGTVKQAEDEVYREALRKHKDLIKSTMSSISLHPVAFKRYKISSNNKVNSIGEIYLLPNFAANGPAQPDLTVVKDQVGLTKNQFQPQTSNLNQNFLHLLGQSVVLNGSHSADRLNKGRKFTYKRNNNKFNGDELIKRKPLHDQHFSGTIVQPEPNRAKLYVTYLNSFVTHKPNAENIIQLYRPRFIQQKRFKKVRLPSGYRMHKRLPLKLFNQNDTTAKSAVNYHNLTPILITIAKTSLKNSTNSSTMESKSQVSFTNQSIVLNQKSTLKSNAKSTVSSNKTAFKVFCTYDAHRSLSSSSNDTRGRFFDINKLDQNSALLKQCSHLVYAFANINMNGEILADDVVLREGTLRNESEQKNQASTLVRLQMIKQRFPRLKLLVAIGGWNTPPQLFSLLVATTKLRDRLSQNIHKFVLNYDLDGVIVSWFYPVYGKKSVPDNQRSTRSTPTGQNLFQLDDKQNLVKFIRSLRTRFDSLPTKQLEIGIMTPPFEELIERGYDVGKLSVLVDHMILMTYDYYGSWEDKVHHFAPLYPTLKDLNERDQKLNINHTLDYWLHNKGAPREKTLMGVAFYGRSFTLENPLNGQPGSKSIGPGIAGPITNKPGLLAFNELCDLYLGHPAVRLSEDNHHITAYLQLFDQWVGFDDELSLYLKTKYAIGRHLSGIFIWSINHDDYQNRCGWGRFPLLKAINKAVEHCKASIIQCETS